MTLHIIYDNTAPVSHQIQSLIGIKDFGKLIFRRRTLLAGFQSAVQAAGLEPPIEINGPADWSRLELRLRGGDWGQDSFLICPSHVVSTKGADALILFLRQALHAPSGLALPVSGGPDWSGWALLSASQFREYLAKRAEADLPGFFERNGPSLIRLEDKLMLIDLDDEVALLGFLSGAFDVRFFNSISQDQYTIVKRSSDTVKLAREYKFFGMLPPLMQMFFIQPFDFSQEDGSASYRMERLHVPDMALQWLHGALTPEEFGRFLDQVFHFLSVRARRAASPGEADRYIDMLFVTKVRDRVEQLKKLPEFVLLKPLLERVCGDVDALFDRYLRLFEKSRSRLPTDHLVIGHGDLCFSNILYSKTSQIMKLIDPRGAESEEDLYTHPFYDLAKLSHSVMGSYDLINHDMFDVEVSESMSLRLVLDRQPPPWAASLFNERLQAASVELNLLRLCEASLFLSMLPLHVDRPRKVLGFAVNTVAILDSIESKA